MGQFGTALSMQRGYQLVKWPKRAHSDDSTERGRRLAQTREAGEVENLRHRVVWKVYVHAAAARSLETRAKFWGHLSYPFWSTCLIGPWSA